MRYITTTEQSPFSTAIDGKDMLVILGLVWLFGPGTAIIVMLSFIAAWYLVKAFGG